MKHISAFSVTTIALAIGVLGAGSASASDAEWRRIHAGLIEQATVRATGSPMVQYVYPSDSHFNNNGSVFSAPTVYIPRENRSVAREPDKGNEKR